MGQYLKISKGTFSKKLTPSLFLRLNYVILSWYND